MFVFLDIDGVLNREKDWKQPYTLCKECVDNFAKAMEGFDVKLILISSWRKGFVSRENPNNLPQIKALEKMLSERGLSITGTVDRTNMSRWNAIQAFLKNHPGDYLILDDDLSEYSSRPQRLYLIDCITGISKKDVAGIRKEMAKEVR